MKKVLSLVLVLTLVLGSFSFAFAAPANDVVGTEYEDAVVRLGQLKVLEGYPDGTFKPENQITRAEFAAVVIRAKGLAAAAQAAQGATAFKDVPAGNWAAGYINIASKMGFVKGMGDGTFAPNAPVTYEQAVTMVMRALGYEPAAEARGGYPYGYLIVANETGLLEKVNGTQGAPALRGTVAKIVDNALEIPLMVQVSYGDRVEHIVSGTREGVKEKTLLSELNFTKFTGRVTEINEDKEFVRIENSDGSKVLYAGEGFDFQNALGLRLRVWYDTLGNIRLYTELDTPMFDAVEHYKGGLYLYGEDDVYDLATDTKENVIATLLLDGKKVAVDKFNADYAKVVLDSYGDVIWAEGFTIEGNVVVEKMDGKVVESYGYEELSLKGYTIVDRDGKTLSVEDLKQNDIVLYNSKVKFAVVYNESITGKIEKVYQNPDSFILDGDKYEVVHELGSTEGAIAKYLDGKVLGNLDYNTVNSIRTEDKEITLYVDFYGNLVLLEGTRAAVAPASVALVIDSVEYESRGTKYYTLDVLNSEGKIVNYDLSQKEVFAILKANKLAEDLSTWSTLVGVSDVTSSSRTASNKIVQLTVNANGKVTGVSAIAGTTNIVDSNTTWLSTTATYVNNKAKLQGNAVVFRVDGETEHKYYSVTTWDKADEEFTRVESGIAYYDKYNNVVAIYAFRTNASAASTYYTGLITDVRVLRGNLKADVTMKIKGEEKVITVPTSIATYSKLVEDTIVKVKVVNKTGEISEVIAIEPVIGKVAGTTPGSRIIKVGSTNYYLENDAVIYQDKTFTTLRFADLKVNDDVALYPIDATSPYVNYVVKGVTSTSGPIATQGTITYIDTNSAGKVYVDFDNGSTIFAGNSAFGTFLTGNVSALNGLKVAFKTNNAGEAIGFTAIELGKATYTNAFINALVGHQGITIAGQGTATTGTVVTGPVTVGVNDVTITNVRISGNLTVNGDNFTSKTNHITGDVTVNGDNASFNTEIGGNVTVNGEGASFSNVKVTGNLVVNEDITVSGSTTVTGTITVAPGAKIDASKATDAKVKEAAGDAADAAELKVAKDAADVALGKVTAAQNAYTNAGGSSGDDVYKAVGTAKTALDTAKAGTDVADIKAKTIGLNNAITALNNATKALTDAAAAETEAVKAVVVAVAGQDKAALTVALANAKFTAAKVKADNMDAYLVSATFKALTLSSSAADVDTALDTVNAAVSEVTTELAKVVNKELAKDSVVNADTLKTAYSIDDAKVTLTVEAAEGANQFKVTLTHKTVTTVKAEKTVTITVATE